MPKLKSSRVRFENEEFEPERPLKKARTHSVATEQSLWAKSCSHRLGILPSGNLLLANSEQRQNIRPGGLGLFNLLPDSVLLLLLSTFDATNLYTLAGVSRAFFAYATHEALWKDLYVSRAEGVLDSWDGSWRYTYLRRFGGLSEKPTEGIRTPGLFSDELFQPALCSKTSLRPYFFPHPTRSRSTILKHRRADLDTDTFKDLYARTSKPVLITGALDTWPAYSTDLWSMEMLERRFEGVTFRAEALDCPFRVYNQYVQDCDEEDSPLYLFDSRFVEKTGGIMGDEYTPPETFGRDFFELLGPERPDYRWLVRPARSGSTFHKDPNGTSAWNAVISGSKGWVLFPPETAPPGVYTNDDESEVTSPLSIPEWFLTYFDVAWETYGPHAKRSENRGKMIIGVCGPGEVVYVPSGWWHLVVNLEESIAVTQNFVSENEVGITIPSGTRTYSTHHSLPSQLSNVLRFMNDKPDQISGFKSSLPPEEICVRFVKALQLAAPTPFQRASADFANKARSVARKRSVWDSLASPENERVVSGSAEGASRTSAFTFGFLVDDDDDDEEIGI
ncbi:hypothetical protein FRB98_004638 [Tulasnella sp. 332]|nr:hypothetical protein FRB98_004638 [Tulasnella sp. 332]